MTVVIRHVVMWSVRGEDAAAHARNIALLKSEFESLRGRVPGLLALEVGVDDSRVDYACDVVLIADFASRQALADYATHPEHLRVRTRLGDLRSARHQVDYELDDDAMPGTARRRLTVRESAPQPAGSQRG
ncbi:MAG TPA: Dabb family protein [Burkholderiaceae bacterium]|nr:Dabb family protein [Burkholderiaceae bacterium]